MILVGTLDLASILLLTACSTTATKLQSPGCATIQVTRVIDGDIV